jgi:hypothetical protein
MDLPGGLPLGQACQQAGINPLHTGARLEDWHPVTLTVGRALTIALLCARHHGRYLWHGILDTETVLAVGAWDCLPWPEAPAAAADPALAVTDGHSR